MLISQEIRDLSKLGMALPKKTVENFLSNIDLPILDHLIKVMFWEGVPNKRNAHWRKELSAFIRQVQTKQVKDTKPPFLKSGEYLKRLFTWPVEGNAKFVGHVFANIFNDYDELPEVEYDPKKEMIYQKRLKDFYTDLDTQIRQNNLTEQEAIDALIDKHIF